MQLHFDILIIMNPDGSPTSISFVDLLHNLTEFDHNEGVYRIVTKLRINGTKGNIHIAHYSQHTCTCGKWQMERFPFSHALAVCRYRGDDTLSIVSTVYTTETYREQYHSDFMFSR